MHVNGIHRAPRITLVVTAAALLLGGCAAKPALRGDRTVIQAAAYEPTFNAAVNVLRDKGFRVDRQDYRFGVVTTLPRTSPVIAEVWDSSNSTGYQALESTFNNQRRVVQVMLEPMTIEAAVAPDAVSITNVPGVSNEPDADPKAIAPAIAPPNAPGAAPGTAAATDPDAPTGQYLLRVEAIIERYENPQHHLSGSTRGHRTLASLRNTPDELRSRGITGPYWYAVRRDPYLEEKLLNAIVEAAATPAPAPDEKAEDR